MDFLYIIILYILTPYVFDATNVKYNQNIGIFINDEVDTTFWRAEPIKTNSEYDLIVSGKPSYGGYYGWLYEAFSEYTVYTSERMWFSARVSWTPLRQGVNITVKAADVENSKPTQVIYNENPAFGIIMGYDVIKYNKARKIPASFSPYFGASALKISYSTVDLFQTKNNFDTALKYHLGFNMQLDSNWSFLTESSFYRLSVRDLDGLAQNVMITPFKIKFGIAYNFRDPELVRKLNKDETYTNIIKSIDVQLDDKIEEKENLINKKKLQEKEKAKQEAQALKDKEAQALKDKEDKEEKDKAEKEKSSRGRGARANTIKAPVVAPKTQSQNPDATDVEAEEADDTSGF